MPFPPSACEYQPVFSGVPLIAVFPPRGSRPPPPSEMCPATAVLRFALAAALLAAVSASSLSCPCGSTGANYTFRNVQVSTTEEACRTWSKCLKCKDEVDYCLECPVGLFGPTCSLRTRSADFDSCPDPGVPPNGVRTVLRPLNLPQRLPTFPVGSHLKFDCEEGFSREGWNSLVCLTGGKWSSSLPSCAPRPFYKTYSRFKPLNEKPPDDALANCSNPGPFSNGYVTVEKPIYFDSLDTIGKYLGVRPPNVRTPDEDQYPQDTRLVYNCDYGYWMNGTMTVNRRVSYTFFTVDCKDTGLWSAEPPNCFPICGERYKMIDYNPVVEWPFMVGLASLSDETSHPICGGVLLNYTTVLTAASCILRNGTFKLLFGKYASWTEDNEEGVVQRTNFTVKVHPDFNNSTHTADIALVHFWPSIDYSARIQPICLPSKETIVKTLALGRIGHVTSWGLTTDSKPPDSYMMSWHSVVTMPTCLRDYEANNLTIPMDPETFCAEHSEAQTNICNGGSPLLFFGYTRKIYFIDGLASLGHSDSCGPLRRYTIFTQVLPYVPWITKNMS